MVGYTSQMSTEEVAIQEAWAKGVEQGVVKARLDGHDTKFASINGTIARFVTEMSALTSAVNTSAADIKARDEVAKALREADMQRSKELIASDERRRDKLQDEEEIRRKALIAADEDRARKLDEERKKSEVNWMPWARGFVIITVLMQLVGLYYQMNMK